MEVVLTMNSLTCLLALSRIINLGSLTTYSAQMEITCAEAENMTYICHYNLGPISQRNYHALLCLCHCQVLLHLTTRYWHIAPYLGHTKLFSFFWSYKYIKNALCLRVPTPVQHSSWNIEVWVVKPLSVGCVNTGCMLNADYISLKPCSYWLKVFVVCINNTIFISPCIQSQTLILELNCCWES